MLASIHVALHAETLLHRDRDYIVRGGRVEIVDEFTGRVADNCRWPHGIQPALEAKEGVEVRPEGVVLGSIPLQHLVRLWPRVAGMTATAVPAAEEFHALYNLTTVVFPPNRPCRRVDEPDVVFTGRDAKATALIDEIARVHSTGRPVLVGTASVAESEALSRALRSRGVKCRVLNARHDAREARIVARAGVPGAVTISTNMAGRGTDIVLGGGDAALRAELERAVGAGELGRVERRLTLLLLDRRWSDHLAVVDDIREGIYLQRVGGKDPLAEFQRQIIDAFAAAMEELRDDVVEAFGRLKAEGGRIDLDRIGLRVPASTWTYLVNDDPFKSAWFRLIGPGGFGHAVAATFLAVVYWPLSFALAAAPLVRRRQRRRAGRHRRT